MLGKRILVVDEQPLFRCGLIESLDRLPFLQVLDGTSCARQALSLAREFHPHAALVSTTLPGINGTVLASVLQRQPLCCSVALLVPACSEYPEPASPVYAASRILRNATEKSLVARVGTLLETRGSGLSDNRTYLEGVAGQLSTRELEILDCVLCGLANRQIAEELFITEQTVKNHMTSVLRKLDVDDRLGAVLYAVRNGWVDISHGPKQDPPQLRIA